MGVATNQANMIGEKRKLTRCVPNRCIMNTSTKMTADTQVTTAATPDYILLVRTALLRSVSLIYQTRRLNIGMHILQYETFPIIHSIKHNV
jgi:hypothetical protein